MNHEVGAAAHVGHGQTPLSAEVLQAMVRTLNERRQRGEHVTVEDEAEVQKYRVRFLTEAVSKRHVAPSVAVDLARAVEELKRMEAVMTTVYRVRYSYIPLIGEEEAAAAPWSAIVRARSPEEAEAKVRAHHVADGGREDFRDMRDVRVEELDLESVHVFPDEMT